MSPKILRIRFFAVPDPFRGALPPVLFALVAMEEVRLFQSMPQPDCPGRAQKHAVRLREMALYRDANRPRTWHALPGYLRSIPIRREYGARRLHPVADPRA